MANVTVKAVRYTLVGNTREYFPGRRLDAKGQWLRLSQFKLRFSQGNQLF